MDLSHETNYDTPYSVLRTQGNFIKQILDLNQKYIWWHKKYNKVNRSRSISFVVTFSLTKPVCGKKNVTSEHAKMTDAHGTLPQLTDKLSPQICSPNKVFSTSVKCFAS